jgi:uncharacterized membrane protein YtjA (UPF0391 family)
MLLWAVMFLVIAILAAFLGFGVAVVTFAAFAKLLFYIAVILCAVSLVGHLMHRI